MKQKFDELRIFFSNGLVVKNHQLVNMSFGKSEDQELLYGCGSWGPKFSKPSTSGEEEFPFW